MGDGEFEVELLCADLLTQKMHDSYGLRTISETVPLSLHYEVNVAGASLRPLTLEAWRSLDSSAAVPGGKAPAYSRKVQYGDAPSVR